MKNQTILSTLILFGSLFYFGCKDEKAIKLEAEDNLNLKGTYDLSVVSYYQSNLTNFDSTVKMSIRNSGDTVFYSIEHLNLDSSLEVFLYDHSKEVIDSTDFSASVPNNGSSYWIIPFDKNASPVIISGAGSVVCTCSGGGECCTVLFSSNGYYCQSCNPNPCFGLCEVNYLAATWQGVGVIVKADQVIYD